MDAIKRAQLEDRRRKKARVLEDVRIEAEVLQSEIDEIDAELETDALPRP
jgi:hypothetical protein